MPELPDVETFRRYLGRKAVHHRVRRVRVHSPRMVRGTSPAALSRRVEGSHLERPRRHGKLLFVDLAGKDGDGGTLLLHFGMTGFLHHSPDPAAASPHPRLTLELDDGARLDYDDQRMFGRVELVDDPQEYLRRRHIGPDVLSLSRESFVEKLHGRRGAIKSALMDQELMAGLGNVYSDEVLFHARLHPQTPAAALDRQRLGRLHGIVRRVMLRAIDAEADPVRMPRTWLTPHRRRGAACPRCGASLTRASVGGRFSWHCPRCQRRR